MNEEWYSYFEKKKEEPPSQTAIDAMEQFKQKCGKMIDLGCGAGNDAMYFLKKGWKVLAIDFNIEFIETVREKMPEDLQDRLEICKMSFEKLEIKMPVDCIVANFSIPFCNPKQFASMWRVIVNGIKTDGVFSGIFFGNRDAWAKDECEKMSFHTLEQIQNFMKEFKKVSIKEEEWDGRCYGENGELEKKHWHIFRVLGRKS